MSTVSSIYPFYVEIWSKNKEKTTDFFLFFTILLISTGFYYITCILKLKILIFRLRFQITEIKKLIVLLDNHALILEKNIKLGILAEQADNRIIAAAVGIAVAIAIVLLFFFFAGGGPGGSSTPGDSFTPRGSEGSLSRSPSMTDVGVKDTHSENWDISTNNLVSPTPEVTMVETNVQVLQQEQLQMSLNEILDKAANKLLPTLSNWIEFSNQKILFFDESPTVRVGSAVQGWLSSLDISIEKIRNNDVSVEVLQSVDSTMKSITANLPDFLKQLDRFMSKANLNSKTPLETSIKDYEFILDSREVANELLQKLLENEALLTQMSPGSIVFPEWFPGLICYFSMLNVISNPELVDLIGCVRSVYIAIHDHFTSGTPDFLKYKDTLLQKLYYYHTKMREFMDNTPDHISTLRYISVAKSQDDFDRMPHLLTKLLEYHECLRVDPSNIFLFV